MATEALAPAGGRAHATAAARAAAVAMLPLIHGELSRPMLLRDGVAVSARQVLAQAQALAHRLPDAANIVNLCEDRGRFLVGFCAAVIAGRVTLLPPSRAPQAVAGVRADHGPAAIIDDAAVDAALPHAKPQAISEAPQVATDRLVAIGFTSGSTGAPKPSPKTWGAFAGSTALNLQAFGGIVAPPWHVLATVPSQHMYGMETCVLLPLLGNAAIAIERPLFPQDLADTLARLPAPRMLVTTPVHLRAFVESGLTFPPPDLIISATAPLSRELAERAEQAFGATLLEVFGSTETCIIGRRRTAREDAWHLYPSLRLNAQEDGTRIDAPYLPAPVLLQDHLQQEGDRFTVAGRVADLIEIAGKRASLGDIALRLSAIPGVADAAVLQAPPGGVVAGVQRIVAFVVAPDVDDAAIHAALREHLDPVFLPRRLIRLEALPRNETGKLRRDALLALLTR